MAKVLAKVMHLMDLSKITTSTLEALSSSRRSATAFSTNSRELEAAITGVYSGGKSEPSAPASQKGRAHGRSARRRRSQGRPRRPRVRPAVDAGRLKARILAALKSAGDKGVAVKELSAKLGVKNQNVHVWFSSTGKKLGTIQRVGAGRYRLKPGA